MDGIHDLGGRHGFGAVCREENEPVFHERWEAGIWTITQQLFAAGLIGNVDQFRHAIERIDPVAYLSHGYYGRWLGGIETLLREGGVLSAEELCTRVLELGGSDADRVAARPDPAAGPLPAAQERGAARAVEKPPAFAAGQLVRTAATSTAGHTRLPGYTRGRTGTVVAARGGWVFPDSNAHGRGEHPEHLYCVHFDGGELWGAEAEPGTSVHLDLFESYLEAVLPEARRGGAP